MRDETHLRSFLDMLPPYDDQLFYRIVTKDASAAGGAAAACAPNVAAALRAVVELGSSTAGLALLSATFSTCQPLQTASDAAALAQWLADPWATLAMGNFPYPSSYLLNGLYDLPAWPVRAACRCAVCSLPNLSSVIPRRSKHVPQVAGRGFARECHSASRGRASGCIRLLQRQFGGSVLLQPNCLFCRRVLLRRTIPSATHAPVACTLTTT